MPQERQEPFGRLAAWALVSPLLDDPSDQFNALLLPRPVGISGAFRTSVLRHRSVYLRGEAFLDNYPRSVRLQDRGRVWSVTCRALRTAP